MILSVDEYPTHLKSKGFLSVNEKKERKKEERKKREQQRKENIQSSAKEGDKIHP